MSNQASDLQLLRCNDFKRSIKAHQEVVICVLFEDSNKGLLELRSCETVGKNHMAASRVWQALHLKQTYLIETTGKDINNMPIVSSPFGQGVVELDRFLVVLDIISINVVMRPNRLSELGRNNHAGSLRCRTAGEEHYPGAGILKGSLKKS